MTYEIRSNNGVQATRIQYHPRCHRVNEHLVNHHIWEVLGYLHCNLVPKNHAVALGIALGDNSEKLPGTLACNLETEPHQSLNAVASEDCNLRRHLPWLAAVRTASLASVFTLAVLTDYHPVEVAGSAVSKRRPGAKKDASWTNIGVLLEGLANGEAQLPQGDMVRHV